MHRLDLLRNHLNSALTGVNVFENVKEAPADPVFGVNDAFKKETNPKKVNLVVGAYRDDAGKPYLFRIVRKVEKEIYDDPAENKEYASMTGIEEFNVGTQKMLFGPDSTVVKEKRVASVQCLSGTGSLRLICDFLLRHNVTKKVLYQSDPTWANHPHIFESAGFTVKKYRYYKEATLAIDFEGFIADLKTMEPGAAVLLHACAHNPTGVDPTKEEWAQVLKVVQERGLFPFFDSAYQGYATGDIENDAYPVRLFANAGVDLVVAQSFAKNMGLYGERAGAVHVTCQDSKTAAKVKGVLGRLVRAIYSNPPIHGGKIVARILNSPDNYKAWAAELKEVSERIIKMRHALRSELERLGTPGTWNHITDQIGMFSYTGLKKDQVLYIRKKHAIYMVGSGRISIAGLNTKNVAYVAAAIKDTVQNS